MQYRFSRLVLLMAASLFAITAAAETPTAPILREAIDAAVEQVTPALVRIHVVETYYSEGRELKYEASGSGVVITPEGHVITNHHVAGHATQIKCVFANKEEIEAELVGTDPLTDIAVLALQPEAPRTFPVVSFGDSSKVRVGDHVLAMGSPLALSQSVTLGIVSNTEMIMPEWINRWGGLEQDGEDVGALVRWIGHDADIYGGNSGGPLVDLSGKIIGINEISMGLSGAIPGNLAQDVASAILESGKVRRAWIGLQGQPRLKHGDETSGLLVAGVISGGPAAEAGVAPGDLLLAVGDTPVDVQFAEQLPDFNLLVSKLPIGGPVTLSVNRAGEVMDLTVTPREREPYEYKQYELKAWGVTVRDISYMMAKELKRDTTDGVLVTSVSQGGGAGDAKPAIVEKDILVAVDDTPVKSVSDLRAFTEALLEKEENAEKDRVPVLTTYERKTGKYITLVEVGLREIRNPAGEVKKAWLPVETQVLTRDIAEGLGEPDLTGFRITQVYKDTTAEKAGLQVGDFILAVDGERMTANAPEQYEELPAYIRQYRVGDTAELSIRRGDEALTIPVELVRAPRPAREMRKYRNDEFEFTVRDITFFDKANEKWEQEARGVLVEQVKSGSWASLGGLMPDDLVLQVNGQAVPDVDAMKAEMEGVATARPDAVVFRVLRGIHTLFVELEPKWES